MVAIYCSHCDVVFPNINELHNHIQKQVPEGSYTFDFKSQTGYPSEIPFPLMNPADIKKSEGLKDKRKKLTQQKRTSPRKAKQLQENDEYNEEPNIPIVTIKEDPDRLVSDHGVSDLDVTDPEDSIQEDQEASTFEEYCGDLLYRNYANIIQNGESQDSNDVDDINVVDDEDDALGNGRNGADKNLGPLNNAKPPTKLGRPKKSECSTMGRKPASLEDSMPCYICGVPVKRCDMKDHVIGHGDSRKFECNICKRRYFTKDLLKQHQRDFHRERIFKCHLCPKSYRKEKVLKDHIRGHSGEKKYICPICGEAFRWYHSLADHEYKHTGLLKFECSHCGKKFKRNTNLNVHIKNVHDRLKDWICSWPGCNKQFYGGPTLRRHMILHTGEKPVKCDHCEAGFIQRNELKIHLQKKHDIDKLPPPSNNNLFTGLPQVTIQNPFNTGEDKAVNLKTFFFPSVPNSLFEGLVIKYKDPNQFSASMKSEPEPDTSKDLADPEQPSLNLEEFTMQYLQELTAPLKNLRNKYEGTQQHSTTKQEEEEEEEDDSLTDVDENLYTSGSQSTSTATSDWMFRQIKTEPQDDSQSGLENEEFEGMEESI